MAYKKLTIIFALVGLAACSPKMAEDQVAPNAAQNVTQEAAPSASESTSDKKEKSKKKGWKKLKGYLYDKNGNNVQDGKEKETSRVDTPAHRYG